MPKLYVQATYELTSRDRSHAAKALCYGQTIGNPDLRTQYDHNPAVTQYLAISSYRHNELVVQFPTALFRSPLSFNYLLSVLMGGQTDIDYIESCRLVHVRFDKHFLTRFPKPRYGIAGLRELVKAPRRPLLCGIIKPKVGLTTPQLVKLCTTMAQAGVDIIKEDEILDNQRVSPFKERVPAIAAALKGGTTLYMPCVTSDGSATVDKALWAQRNGATAVHANIWTGLGTYFDLRRHIKIPIFLQRSGIRTWTTGKYSIAEPVLYSLAQLAGCDMGHIGMYGGYLRETAGDLHKKIEAFTPAMPSFSCGMTPEQVPLITGRFGHDVLITAGGSIHSHPDGVAAGIAAFRRMLWEPSEPTVSVA